MNLAYELEFYRVVFHGMLHLCGYKDKNKEDVVVMREKEDFYIQWFVSRETNTI
jgi:ssRNA-specific RNase YbeY (16S rRNA maturation enzyme)